MSTVSFGTGKTPNTRDFGITIEVVGAYVKSSHDECHAAAEIEYRDAYAQCRQLLDAAFMILSNTSGREDVTRELEVGSRLFTKLILHVKATVDLAPKGPLGGEAPEVELWDLSSIAVLVRAEVDTYEE